MKTIIRKGTIITVVLAILLCAVIALSACSCGGEEESVNALESIKITSPPDKTEYLAGELFDPTGMTVTAVYEDGTQKTAENWSVVDGDVPLGTDDTYIQIMYTEGEFSRFARQPITVNADLSYFNAADAIRDNTEKCPISSANADQYVSVGSDPAVVSYIGAMDQVCAVTFYVTSDTAQNVKMTICAAGQEDGTMPFNKMFDVIVNNEQVEIPDTAMMENEQKIKYFYFTTVTTDIALAEGDNTITVRSHVEEGLDCKATNFAYIRLLPESGAYDGTIRWTQLAPDPDDVLESIAVVTQPDNTEYNAGAVFDASGMVVEATFADGYVYEVPHSELTLPTEGLEYGTNSVTVSYTYNNVTRSAEIDITVLEKRMTSLSVTGEFRKDYYAFEYFDPTGMTVMLNYSDGTSKKLTAEQYTYDTSRLEEGTSELTVKHTDSPLTASVPITVAGYDGTPVVFSVLAALGESNSEQPDASSPAYDFVSRHGFGGGFNQGKTVTFEITSPEDQTVRADITVAGHENGDRAYAEMFAVAVNNEPVKIGSDVIVPNPSKVPYFYFSTVSLAIRLNEGKNTITFTGLNGGGTNFSGITITSPASDGTVSGVQTAPGAEATLESIAISGSYRTQYADGERFDTTGLTVTASYSDGFTGEISDYIVTPEILTLGTEEVTVSYTYGSVTRTATIDVTVTAYSGQTLHMDAVNADTNGNIESGTVSSNPEVTVNGNVGGLNDPTPETKYVGFSVVASGAGKARLSIAVAADLYDKNFDDMYITYFNENTISVNASVPGNSQQYTYFRVVTVVIDLVQGENHIEFRNNGSAATNFAWIEITPQDSGITVAEK